VRSCNPPKVRVPVAFSLSKAWVYALTLFLLLAFIPVLPGGEATQVTSTSLRGAFEVAMLGLGFLLALGVIAYYRAYHVITHVFRGPSLFIVLFAVWATFSSLWSPDPVLTAAKGLELFAIAGICLVVVFLSQRHQLDHVGLLRRVLLTLIAVLFAVNLLAHGTPFPQTADYRPRFFLGFGHPLTTGTLLALTILLTLFSRVSHVKRILILLPLGALLLMADARGPTLGLLAAAAAVLWLIAFRQPYAWFKQRVGLYLAVASHLALAALVLMGLGLTALPHVLIDYVFQQYPDARTLNGRLEVWGVALSVTRDHLLTGVGYSATRFFLINQVSWGAGQAHNALIETLMSVGLVGTVFFLGFFFTVLCGAIQAAKTGRYVPIAIVVYVSIQGIFSPLFITPSMPTALLVLISVMERDLHARTERKHDAHYGRPQLLPTAGR
jgi:O-antigen ligase